MPNVVNYAERWEPELLEIINQNTLCTPFITNNVRFLDARTFHFTSMATSGFKSHMYDAAIELQAIKFIRAAEDKKDILMLSFPAHATTVNGTNSTLISACWPGATRAYIEAGKDREGKGFDPRKLLAPGFEAIKATVKEKMELFGSVNKA